MHGNSSHPHAGRTVLVTDAGRGSAVAVIRSLGRNGYRVIAADSASDSLGFRSRFAHSRFCYPPPEADAERYVAAMLRAAGDRGVDLIIPVTDAALLPLAHVRSRFTDICRLAVPEDGALEVVTNKLKTLELARHLGVPCPETRLVGCTAEALQAAPALGWPVVLKPLASRQFREHRKIDAFSVSYAASDAGLAERMAAYEGRCPVLLQAYHRGVGYGVELVLANGRPLAAFQHRRLREVPVSGGASAFRESVPLDPQLYRYSVQLLAALAWTGLAMVEFKVGENGPMLMEINGRVWGSLPLAVASGVDFPALLAAIYLQEAEPTVAVELKARYRVGLRSRNLGLELLWIMAVLRGHKRYPFLHMPRRREALRAALQLFDPRARYDILSLSDPVPGLLEIRDVVRKLGRKVREAA